MINFNNINISKNDKTLAVIERWDTATHYYYNHRADKKRIPTNAKGFRLRCHYKDTFKQAADGSIYIIWHNKDWNENGTQYDCWGVNPVSTVDYAVETLDRGEYTPDCWGNTYSHLTVYKNGKRGTVPGLGKDNIPLFTQLVNGWLENGAKLFPESAERTWLDKNDRRAYRA